MMTALLKQAFAQAEKLPAWEQDALAAFIMEEIAASYQWNKLDPPLKRANPTHKQQAAKNHNSGLISRH